MPEFLDDSSQLESTTVGVYRTSTTVKGGRRFSFSSLVVVGDRSGRLGVGYGKANQVPQAIEKAQKVAKRKMCNYPLLARTIPHTVTGRFGACKVQMLPASPGTGVIAGAAVRAPLEMLGVQDCLTKAHGSTNPKNLVKAVVDGLSQLRSKSDIALLRGTNGEPMELGQTTVEESIERSRAFITATSGEKAKAPVNTVKPPSRRGRPGGGGRRRRKDEKETTTTATVDSPAGAAETKPETGA